MTSIWGGSHVKSAGKYVDSSGKRWFWISNQMDLRNHLRLLYDIRKLLLDIANETAYTMDPMEVVLEHAIHSRNPYSE